MISKRTEMIMDRRKRSLEGQLCKAVNDGEPRSVQLLLSQGARPDLLGCKGVAAIHLAVGKETEKNMRCLKMMLEFGADPNIRSSEGLTPLHIAALWGCYQNLKMLLMNGGDPNIKDNEGNTPGQLAVQQENRKCALVLQEYQASSVDTEEDDSPQFQYSVYSDQTDTSSYPASDSSFSSHSSMMSDSGEALLSSTRRSSFFNMANMNGGPGCRGFSYNRLSDVDSMRHHNQDWNNSFAHWAAEGPSILSSTRMSAVGLAAPMPILKEDDLLTNDDVFKSKENEHADGRISPSRRDTLPALHSRRTCRKSVSFRDVDEFFPVFSPDSPKQQHTVDGSQCPSNLTFDLSEYSGFLDSERMATVLHKQGIDVTSPDHVYVFSRECSTSTEEDMEKTVINHCALQESDDGEERETLKEAQVNIAEQPARSCGSSSSGTASSDYSSCDSDHYTSALDASVLHPAEEEASVGHESGKKTEISTDSDSECMWRTGNLTPVKPQIDSEPETTEHLQKILDKLSLRELKSSNNEAFASNGSVVDTSSEGGVDEEATKLTTDAESDAVQVLEEVADLPFTPSPFVTGRTRSRLSRCSLRTSKTHESLLLTSSLFEETLPSPVRTRHQTPRSRSSKDYYSSPHVTHYTPSYSGSSTGGDPLPADCQDTQSCTLRAGSSVSHSQEDTIILSKSVTESQTLSDTVLLGKDQDSVMDAYEINLAEVALAMRGQDRDVAKGLDFMTDDLTSTDEATTKGNVNDNPVEARSDSVRNEDLWITEDCSSQPDSASSSSSSSYFSPRRSRDDSDPVSTPGTGCTPRYSMSRLSGCRRSQHLANVSYTPGGRPLIQDLEEPVEYLYTDTEQGHKLIETHVPPTSDTSFSSSTNTTSSEDTILYDWRFVQTELTSSRGKENQKPPTVIKKEKHDEGESPLLPDTKGITDKELRSRLLELGESPGPISSRTRPTYMKRLRRLMQESQSPHHQKQLGQPQTVDFGYSPELCRALKTFQLPDCQTDEQDLCQQFDQPDQNRKWREGVIKSSFNYLLLDPRVTKNLPFRSHTMTPQECFQAFVNAIFYVGKGKRSRPYSHLYEALEYYRGDKTCKKLCPKVQHILQVWEAGQGVVSLHCFQNVIPVEAFTREACMVEAIGLKMLTNQKRGDFYGVASNWQVKRKRELGVHMLSRAMQIFLAEGERQLRPADIRQ
ncbi:ankyrin repeat and LEM domain-containing protein 1 [Hippoglossus hippoglossus]|uniref:ankyrin repeat and LEM domain-containing protein 1 n=1 Tax=Hippoglossus hippoglossus TaxID=8267 RepID=UPI00148C61EA|nr:ankyrin repeat and LEM domain-containing protein 1 [Hippoglossus hippoglossus]